MHRPSLLAVLTLTLVPLALLAGSDDLPAGLERLGARVTAPGSADVFREVRERLHQAGLRESRAWSGLKGRGDWEKYRDPRIQALRASLGSFPAVPKDLDVRVRKTIEGDGHHIDCLTFHSRPGLTVTANLYRPARPGKSMPGILLVHSHHNPKTEGELQDMGVMWARGGCLVLVMDLLGHGERRQHPFRSSADYPESFRPGRQDYFFRYNLAIGLQTIGDSLMGWMVWDLMRGVDLLLSRPGIDPARIAILGAVAGGGDPAAVAAALDRRITAAVIFNFGGPQPETRHPLPEDAETTFGYTGSGSWESTRNLARSAKDGFLPWVIVGAIAPRRHVHAHEFSWDEVRDPVWKRLRTIHGWYETPERLTSARGTGLLRGKPPEASHCNNIGPVHRKGIHQAFQRWFALKPPIPEPRDRRPSTDLLCLDKDERPTPVHRLAADLGRQRAARLEKELVGLPGAKQRARLRQEWGRLLGDVEPVVPDQWLEVVEEPPAKGTTARWVGLLGDTSVWGLVLTPAGKKSAPAVVAFAQGGPKGFLTQRTKEIADLLARGNVVVLAELGGLSNQMPGSGRGRSSSATSLASSMLMLGQPVLGERLRELRTLLGHLRECEDIDPARISLWGDSFAPVNAPSVKVERPLEVAQPPQAEPLGGLLALLGGLFEEEVVGIRARGGLVSYQAVLESPFVHVPYDIVVPGALTAGDLGPIVKSLAGRTIRIEKPVDGLNRAAP